MNNNFISLNLAYVERLLAVNQVAPRIVLRVIGTFRPELIYYQFRTFFIYAGDKTKKHPYGKFETRKRLI